MLPHPTCGKSSPLAATSVAKSTTWAFWQNCVYVARRFICFWRPCRHRSDVPGRSAEKAAWMYCTCLHDEQKTMTLSCRCDLTKLHSISSLCSASTTW